MGPPTIHIHMAMAPAPSFLEFSIRVSIAARIAECQCQKACLRRTLVSRQIAFKSLSALDLIRYGPMPAHSVFSRFCNFS